MDASDVHLIMRWMLACSGKSRTQVTREVGMSENWLGECFRKRSVPSLLSFVGLADACGFRVEIADRKGTVVATLDQHGPVKFH